MASAMGVRGSVANSTAGVEIFVQGAHADEFIERLRSNPPPLARITSFQVRRLRARKHAGFAIVSSQTAEPGGVDVLPDIATCRDCRKELLDPRDRRHEYPFINCTQCGPRYTITETLPYDRRRTTMANFKLCRLCAFEYGEPDDRRFHAQPDACAVCGPRLFLLDARGRRCRVANPLATAAGALARGSIVAIKSLGGFQLACDAANDRAVRRLRRRKTRPAKPFALMCSTPAVASRFCRVSATGRSLLVSPAAPIVLLPKRTEPTLLLSPGIAPANSRIGVMLAYTPLHFLLLRELKRGQDQDPVMVMTSANRRDDPLVGTDSDLVAELNGVFDFVLTHDRPIANRCDDSVVLDDHPAVMVRRARGYAPQPLLLDPMFHVKHPTLALGGELRNCFTFAVADRAFLSPHLGNLSSTRTERFFDDTLKRYVQWTGVEPARIACDLHPDYLSTRMAEHFSRTRGIPLARIQHHYAHTVSVMAEHGVTGPTLGVSLDGTGYGIDGTTWGCEFLLVGPDLGWRRVAHLGCLKMTESGMAVASPGRIAAAYLLQVSGRVPSTLGLGRLVPPVEALLRTSRATTTSSLGRLFDAVAAITGIRRTATYEGEAPIALEDAVRRSERGRYPCVLEERGGCLQIDPKPLLAAVVQDTLKGTDPGIVASRFHNTIVDAIVRTVRNLGRHHRFDHLLLSGGSLQNDILRQRVTRRLQRAGNHVLRNHLVPVNDGGISLGQAVAADAALR
jgi:hydrogenase maturation protein HypF